MPKKKPDNGKQDEIINAGLAGAAGDVVERYGSAVKEHLVGYSGIDNELGTVSKKGLKTISEFHRPDPQVDPANYQTTTKQQAGWAAEIKETSRSRAEEAISGKKPTTMRTDDIIGPDGQRHHVNDQLFDISSAVDGNGNPIPGASAQMKFVGSSPEAAVEKMLSPKYQKYIDNDVRMIVPGDYYDGMLSAIDDEIPSLEKQIDALKAQGKPYEAKLKRLNDCKTLKKNLVKSQVSNAEALEARNSPLLSTAKDIAGVSHRAGWEQAKMGAAIGGGMSLISNLVAVYKGEKDAKEASLAIFGDTTKAAAVSYVTGFAGSALKGTMQNSSSALIKGAAKTNLPAQIVVATLEVGKTMKAYLSGEIDGAQCLEQLGEKGCGALCGSLGAVIGQAAIPIPVVGAMAGSMLGYALSAASYGILKQSLQEAKVAHEERLRIEAEVAASIKMLREYRAELEAHIGQYLQAERDFFDTTFANIKDALAIGDADGYIAATNAITRKMGKRPLFENCSEFDSLMASDEPLRF